MGQDPHGSADGHGSSFGFPDGLDLPVADEPAEQAQGDGVAAVDPGAGLMNRPSRRRGMAWPPLTQAPVVSRCR
ncbi:hypothetical protein ASC58_20050 [Phycicoccus sp. Root101]|nr:hypothetical protein ASC58_20050 [Phycicoccus sp. Root101]